MLGAAARGAGNPSNAPRVFPREIPSGPENWAGNGVRAGREGRPRAAPWSTPQSNCPIMHPRKGTSRHHRRPDEAPPHLQRLAARRRHRHGRIGLDARGHGVVLEEGADVVRLDLAAARAAVLFCFTPSTLGFARRRRRDTVDTIRVDEVRVRGLRRFSSSARTSSRSRGLRFWGWCWGWWWHLRYGSFIKF